jgi:NADH:ubiquinone oxidoreductase subunit C
MNKEQLIEQLNARIQNIEITEAKQILEISTAPNHLFNIVNTLKTDAAFSFDYLFNLMGVDVDDKLGVYYYFESTAHNHQLLVKCFGISRDKAALPSLVSLYPGVELLEREVFEFYGINFEGHPDLRNLFLPDDWDGFPMRKDYYDPINIVER